MRASAETCRTCRHLHLHPIDPQNIGAPRTGECRAQPPLAIHVMTPQGPRQLAAAYLIVGATTPACGLRAEGSPSELPPAPQSIA